VEEIFIVCNSKSKDDLSYCWRRVWSRSLISYIERFPMKIPSQGFFKNMCGSCAIFASNTHETFSQKVNNY